MPPIKVPTPDGRGLFFEIAGNEPTEAEKSFIAGRVESYNKLFAPPPPPPPPPVEEMGPFRAGLMGLYSNIDTLIGGAAEGLGYDEAAKRYYEAAARTEKEVSERYKPVDIFEAQGLGDVAQFGYESLASSIPYFIPMAVGSLATGGLGAVAGLTGGALRGAQLAGGLAGGIIPEGGGNIARTASETGKSVYDLTSEDWQRALAFGAVQSSLDLVAPAVLGMFGRVAKLAASGDETAKKAAEAWYKRVPKGAFKGLVAEAPTEGAQQALQILQANPEKFYEFDTEVQKEIITAAVAGGMVGKFLGGVAGGLGLDSPEYQRPEDEKKKAAQALLDMEAGLAGEENAAKIAKMRDEYQRALAEETQFEAEDLKDLSFGLDTPRYRASDEMARYRPEVVTSDAGTAAGYRVAGPTGETVAEYPSFDAARLAAQTLNDSAPYSPSIMESYPVIPTSSLDATTREALVKKRYEMGQAGLEANTSLTEIKNLLGDAIASAERERLTGSPQIPLPARMSGQNLTPTSVQAPLQTSWRQFVSPDVERMLRAVSAASPVPEPPVEVVSQPTPVNPETATPKRDDKAVSTPPVKQAPPWGEELDLDSTGDEEGFTFQKGDLGGVDYARRRQRIKEKAEAATSPETAAATPSPQGPRFTVEAVDATTAEPQGVSPRAVFDIFSDGKKVASVKGLAEAQERANKMQADRPTGSFVVRPRGRVFAVNEYRGSAQGDTFVSTVRTFRDQKAAQDYANTLNETRERRVKQRVANREAIQRYENLLEKQKAAWQIAERRLKQMGAPPDLIVRVRSVLENPDTAIADTSIEGYYDASAKLMAVSLDIWGPDLSTQELADRIAGVINHEFVHVLQRAGAFSKKEWKVIRNYLKTAQSYEPDGRMVKGQTWYERAKNMGNASEDKILREAMSEAFRTWTKNKSAVTGKPASIFRRIVEIVKTLGGFGKSNARIEQIFREIDEGKRSGVLKQGIPADVGAIDLSGRKSDLTAAGGQDERILEQDLGRGRGGRGRTGGDQGRGYSPLPGAPVVKDATGPDPNVVEAARSYAESAGITFRRQAEYAKADPERGRRIADAYEKMPHAPQDPKVREAYEDLKRQTRAQYEALIKAGYEFTFYDQYNDPYGGNPMNAMRDLRKNKRMAVYGTYDGYGTEGVTGAAIENNPLLEDTGLTWPDQNGTSRPVTANDLFRAVHDAFGHSMEGAGFRADGEENAWQAHIRLYTGPAIGAATSELRGQNSWLNFGPYGEKNAKANVFDTVFAEQKIGLMPEWTWQEGIVPDEPSDFVVPAEARQRVDYSRRVSDIIDMTERRRGEIQKQFDREDADTIANMSMSGVARADAIILKHADLIKSLAAKLDLHYALSEYLPVGYALAPRADTDPIADVVTDVVANDAVRKIMLGYATYSDMIESARESGVNLRIDDPARIPYAPENRRGFRALENQDAADSVGLSFKDKVARVDAGLDEARKRLPGKPKKWYRENNVPIGLIENDPGFAGAFKKYDDFVAREKRKGIKLVVPAEVKKPNGDIDFSKRNLTLHSTVRQKANVEIDRGDGPLIRGRGTYIEYEVKLGGKGDAIGTLHGSVADKRPDVFYVDYASFDPDDMKLEETLGLINLLGKDFPDIREVVGFRTSGAKFENRLARIVAADARLADAKVQFSNDIMRRAQAADGGLEYQFFKRHQGATKPDIIIANAARQIPDLYEAGNAARAEFDAAEIAKQEAYDLSQFQRINVGRMRDRGMLDFSRRKATIARVEKEKVEQKTAQQRSRELAEKFKKNPDLFEVVTNVYGETMRVPRQITEGLPGLRRVIPYLREDELNTNIIGGRSILEMFENAPDATEMAAVAISGRAKRGWYAQSARALIHVFGSDDAPRFSALLAGLSPQTKVEDNAKNALNMWVNWDKAGRPTDRDTIIRILGQSVQGKKGEGSILDAWKNNSVTALQAIDPHAISISGNKVNSFMLNLNDVVHAVTNDAWMANYGDVDQNKFSGSSYHGYSAKVRMSAEIASELTGYNWTPREIQETVWSWAKTAYELRKKLGKAGGDQTVGDLLRAGKVTNAMVANTPDFATLFTDGVYRGILERGGYSNEIERIISDNRIAKGSRQLDAAFGARSVYDAEGAGIAPADYRRYLDTAADRLEQRYQRRKAEAAAKKASGKRLTEGEDSDLDYSRRIFTPADIANSVDRIRYTGVRNMLMNSISKLGKPIGITEANAKSVSNAFLDNFVDHALPLGEIVDRVREMNGSIPDAFDAYLKQQVWSSKTEKMLERISDTYYKPMMRAVKDIQISEADLAEFKRLFPEVSKLLNGNKDPRTRMITALMYARHAPERNLVINEMNNGSLPNGSGMTTAEAEAVVRWFESRPNWGQYKLAEKAARRIIEETNNIRVAAGLTPDFRKIPANPIFQKLGMPNGYRYYVPLRGLLEEDALPNDIDLQRLRTGTGLGTKGPEDISAKGRLEMADNVIEHIVLQNEVAVVRANKNEVNRSFYELVKNNQAMLKDVAEIVTKAPMIRRIGDDGTVKLVPDRNYINDDRYHVTKIDGKVHVIEVKDARLARTLNGGTGYGDENIQHIVNFIGGFTRFMSQMATGLNPEFWLRNTPRDVLTGAINIKQYEVEGGVSGLSQALVSNWPKALKAARRANRFDMNYLKTGDERVAAPTDPIDVMYQEFLEDGGFTGYLGLQTIETKIANLNKQITKGEGSKLQEGLEVANRFKEFVEAINNGFENATRFSVYKTLRDAGFTRERAAQAAKTVTTNFNAGGWYKNMINPFYMFYNASIQGSMAILTAGVRSPQVRKLLAAILVGGVMQDLVGAMLSDEDESGSLEYDKVKEWMARTHMILPDPTGLSGDGFVKMPLPFGFNAVYNFGRVMSKYLRHQVTGGDYDLGKATASAIGTLIDATNPLGASQSFINYVAPTILDPVVSLTINRDFDDSIIVKRPLGNVGVELPSSQLYLSSTSPTFVSIADFLNTYSGGTSVMPGYVDLSPDAMQYLFDYFLSGAGAFARRTFDLATTGLPAALQGDFEGVVPNKIPFARAIVGSSGGVDMDRYLEIREEVLRIGKEAQEAAQNSDIERLQSVRENYPKELQVYGIVKGADSQRQSITKRIAAIRQNERIPDEAKANLIRQLKEQEQAAMLRAIRAYNTVVEGMAIPPLKQ